MQDNILNIQNKELGFIADDLRDKNLDKALSVVAPIDGIISNLQSAGKMPKEKTPMDFVMADANKVKMEGYSDVKFQDLFREYSDGTFVARYDKPYSITATDQEDYAASQQTSGEIWGNAFPKYWGKLLNNTVGQLGGIAYGLYDMAQTGSMQSLYDNKFMDYVNDVNTYLDNKLPTYKSKADREATGIDYFSRATTWADDFANGMAFFGGAILSEAAIEWATGGSALSTAGARWGAKLAQSEKFLNTLNKARTLANPAAKVFATGQLETRLATNLGRAGELLNTARFTATSAGFESAFEANAFMKEMEEGYYADFQRLNGRMPTAEEETEFRRNLKTASDGVFATNMAIVGSSNLAVMGKWFNIKNPLSAPGKWVDSKLFGVGYKKVGEEFVETSANKLQKALGKTYAFSKPMFVEGIWEEGMQSVVQNTGRNWVEAKYDPKYTKNGLSLIDSFSNGMAETYGTAEGWKEIQMGMLIGLIGGTAGNRIATGKWNPEYSKAVAENKLIVDTKNTYSGARIAEAMAYGNRVQQAQENSQKAEAAGDFVGQEMSRKDAALAQLNFAYNLGYMDEAVSDTVTAIKNMDNETLMQEYGLDQKGAEELKQKMIAEYKTTAETYKKNSDFANYFVNSKLSKQEKEALKGHDVSALREALAYELTMGAEMDTFSSNILEAIKNKVGTTILGQDISDTLAIEDVLSKASKETKRQVEKKVSQITKLKSEMSALDEEYKKLETTFYNSTSEEQKKSLLDRMDAITAKKSQIEQERNNLAKEADILFNTAKLSNPFNKDGASVIITASKLEALTEQSKAIRDLVSSYEKISPQDALELQKLVEEYTKSLSSFQRYADLARQITDPKLGLRGKRNFISEIKRNKSPNEATLEMIDTLLPRMVQAKNQVVQATLEGNEKVQEVLDKESTPEEVLEEKKNGDTIPKPTAVERQAIKEAEKQKVIDEYDKKISALETPEIVVEDIVSKTTEEQISDLREEEQKEMLSNIPYIESYKENGKVDKTLMTTAVLEKYEEIYDKYDKLIAPLLEKLKKEKVSVTKPDNIKEAEKLEKEKQAKLDAIDKKYQDKTEEPAQEKKSLIDSIIDMVKNSPYLLENFGSNILDLVPTQAEIEEFYELAARAIDDPRIDTELVAFKNPYNSNRFTPTTRPSLTKSEINRLQELNEKMANWQLIEGYQNENGVSLQQMIMQAVAVRQTVEPIIREKLTDSDLINLSDNEPLDVDGSNGIRKEQFIQVYENVFVKKKGNSVQISHLSLPGLLQRMGISGDIGYVQTKIEKGKKVEVKGSAKVIALDEVEENSLPGSNFIVTLSDGSKVNLSVEKSGAISVKSEDFPKVMSEANMKHVEGTLNRNGGYSPVYDLETGDKLKTDYRNASDYSPREIYNMEPGESAQVTFSVDMNDEYNLKLIQNYEKGLEEGRNVEELEKELFENIKINVLDTNGRKLGDLKAAYDTAGVPGFLDLRREAFDNFKKRMESGIMGTVSLSKSSFIKHIFLGSPNFVFEDGSIKMFDIIPEQVIDYGYIENGKVVLKNNTKGVREDFVKGILGRQNQPVVVVKQGKYLVAFPIALKESEANLSDQVTEIFTESKNKAEATLKLNQLLADNGFSPASYNLFYMDENNQNLIDSEGFPTQDLMRAINDLAGVRNVSSVKDWMLPEHTTADLANEASIGVDMTNNIFSSPKPIIELDDLREIFRDWYSEALKNGDVTEEKAVEIATKIFYRKRITLEEAQFVQSDRVTEALNRMYELNNEAQKEANDEKNKPCK